MLGIGLRDATAGCSTFRYVFGFVREIIIRVVHISLRSLHRV